MKIWEIPGIIFDSIPGQERSCVAHKAYGASGYDEKKGEMVQKGMSYLMGKEKIITINGDKIRIMFYKEQYYDVYHLTVQVAPDTDVISMRGIKEGTISEYEGGKYLINNELDMYTYDYKKASRFKLGVSYKITTFTIELKLNAIKLVEKCEP